MMRFVLPFAFLFLTGLTGNAQFDGPKKPTNRPKFSDLGTVTVEVSPKEAKPGQTVQVRLTVEPKPLAWTYPTSPKDKEQPGSNRINWEPKANDLVFVGTVVDPEGVKTKKRSDEPDKLAEYYPHKVTWVLNAVVSPKATPGAKSVPLAGSSIQVCGTVGERELCLNTSQKEMPQAEFTVLEGAPVPVESQFADTLKKLFPETAPAPPEKIERGPVAPTPPEVKPAATASNKQKKAIAPEEYQQQMDAIAAQIEVTEGGAGGIQKTGLLAFLITAATWGLVSLVTPCVFPMIPITVSIFLKQGHQSRVQTIKLATIYCLTIILVLGVSAIALLKVFVDLSVNPWMNVFLGGLFVFFALSLFGMYDIALPQSLLKFTQTKQGAGGVVGTIFGALAFTIVSFTCVAPFLGGFAGMAASGNFTTFELVLGGLAFATAFAFPFFLLALFPGLLKALPRSGGWLDSVKVVMGFLEFAAALKFFRTAEIGWTSAPSYFTYDLVLGGWIAMLIATGLYLFNVFRLPHDEERPNIGVPRLVFALTFLALGVHLAPALLKGAEGKKQRPDGVVFSWVDAFLLPDATLDFGVDLKTAMDAKKPVFIDFTGEQCTNCRYNEHSVFPKPQVWQLMEKYERVQLDAQFEVPPRAYIDPPSKADRFAESQINRDFKDKLFGSDQLPLYVILVPQPGGKWKASVYDEGKINNVDAFKKFLEAGLRPKN
ncbi:MAG: cytochrome c biogenesis protein CcdA [Gemmataceae bacterium]